MNNENIRIVRIDELLAGDIILSGVVTFSVQDPPKAASRPGYFIVRVLRHRSGDAPAPDTLCEYGSATFPVRRRSGETPADKGTTPRFSVEAGRGVTLDGVRLFTVHREEWNPDSTPVRLDELTHRIAYLLNTYGEK